LIHSYFVLKINLLDTTISKETWTKSLNGRLTGIRKKRTPKYGKEVVEKLQTWMHNNTSGRVYIDN